MRTLVFAALALTLAAGCAEPVQKRRFSLPVPLVATVPAPAAPAPMDGSEIDHLVEASMKQGGVVGASVVVLRGDDVAYARGFGFADLARGVPATSGTVHQLGSVTKQLWATALAQLVEEGRLDVEATVQSILPEFPDARVKVRHLLQQTSGLGEDHDGEDDEHFLDHVGIDFEPGSFWHYSNRGALVARRVLERVRGAPATTVLRDRIAAPLGLRSLKACDGTGAATPYDHGKDGAPVVTKEPRRDLQLLCADALDVARFERGLDLLWLVKAETLAKMRTPARIVLGGSPVDLGYGWFTRIGNLGGRRAFGHTGAVDGGTAAVFTFPDDALTVVVLENTAGRPGFEAPTLLGQIARSLLGLPAPARPTDPPPRELLAACSGDYLAGGLRVRVSPRDGQLFSVLLDAHGAPTPQGFPLVWAGGTKFLGGPDGQLLDWPNEFVVLNGKANGFLWGHPLRLDGVATRLK